MDIANHVQSQGGTDVPRYARVYLYGGPLALKDKERLFALLRQATGVAESLDPTWLPNVVELLGRMIRNPIGASDVLRHLVAEYIMCVHLGQPSLPPLSPVGANTEAIVLSKDIATTVVKATGINGKLFAAIDPL